MKVPSYTPGMNALLTPLRAAPRYVANFDSAVAMLRATARSLRGKDFPQLGTQPISFLPAAFVNTFSREHRETVYRLGPVVESIPPGQTGNVRAELLSRWVVSEYPRRTYQAAVIGSTSGALVHLCTALGIPWLPQTFLIPVRQHQVHPDEGYHALEWGREPAERLLAANPELQLHHMHDPNQDRLMVERMAYFRVKRLRLGETYEHFLADTLAPGATIFLAECQRTWPTTEVAERHRFQWGALGGCTPDEYFNGGDRVTQYLRRYGSPRRQWDPPQPDADRPEAEWGFAPELRADVEHFAQRHGYRIRRIVFQEPEHLSPLVADLYRWWYAQRQLHPQRLLIESYILMEPWWALRTGSAPFWMKFNMEPSFDWIMRYLDVSEAYDDMRLMLFSHGVDSIGLVPIAAWRTVLERARHHGSFVGVDAHRYPRDFAAHVRYHTDMRTIPARYAIPAPLTVSQLDAFIATWGDRYPVQWIEHPLRSNHMVEHVT
ncbi:MAG: hypothetical protein M3R24_18010 [Chloroflexota bacterium]|nr:hypothetical protein [Chloroflexota bacterium]